MEKTGDVDYPIKDILTEIANSHGIPLKHFTQEHFLPEAQREQYPILSDLSVHLAFPYGVGIEIEKDNMVAFEGSQNGVSLAYFGIETKKYSNYTKEQALLHSGGRRIHVILNENGNGRIEIKDEKTREAGYKLGEDSFGGSFDVLPKGDYGFMQRVSNSKLTGVKAFLETMLE